jgi:hypothetical protein
MDPRLTFSGIQEVFGSIGSDYNQPFFYQPQVIDAQVMRSLEIWSKYDL